MTLTIILEGNDSSIFNITSSLCEMKSEGLEIFLKIGLHPSSGEILFIPSAGFNISSSLINQPDCNNFLITNSASIGSIHCNSRDHRRIKSEISI